MYNKGNNMTSNNNNNNSTSNLNININNNGTTSNTNSGNNVGGGGTTTDRIEWSRATILDFIEDYRRQRVLWDPNTKGYHIKQTKYEALKLLGHKYGAEIRSIRSKIKSLRSSFHREHGKVLNGRRKGLNYQPMWFAYDAIRFILDGESGDSDEADTNKNDTNNRDTTLSEPNNNTNSNNNNNNIVNINNSIDEELMEERKISSRDIEHFNNHFLALGLQARNPMAVIAAVEAAAAASAAQERRQEQKYAALKQQEIDSATQLKLLELSTNAVTTTTNNNNNSNNDMNLTSTSATFNPISKPFNSPKSSTSPLTTSNTSGVSTPTKTATLLNITTRTTTATPPLQQLPPLSSTSTCSPENLNVLHGSRSLDENSASALAAATAIPSLSITAVARNSDFDGSEYCNISADDVKTEIFESDSTELTMLESTRTSTPVPLNYHKNATDLTINRSGNNNSNNNNNIANNMNLGGVNSTRSIMNHGSSGLVGSRKRKAQMHSNIKHNDDAPSPSKLHQKQIQQHSNVIHSRQCDYLNHNNNDNSNNNNNININNKHNIVENVAIAADVDDDIGDEDDDDGVTYSTSFSHLQTTLMNNNSNSSNINNQQPTTSKTNNNNNNNNNNPIDEYGVFGEYVAITIRKLKTSKAKIVVKHLINNLLYEAELGKYDQGISSCKEPPELYKM
ncbi:dpt-YFP repressor by overexpression [Cochliomyia hominivorax]